MYQYTPGEWHSAQDKRALSVLDKHTLPSQEGSALIMPGEPGTEFEELLSVGYPRDQISCIDDTEDSFHQSVLEAEYGSQFFNLDVFDFVEDASSNFSYIHFDMCSMSNADTYQHLVKASRKLESQSRLRYSGMRTLRGNNCSERMAAVRQPYKALKMYCLSQSRSGNKDSSQFWKSAAEACETATDEAGGILAGLFLSLPPQKFISNIYKKTYLGKDMYAQMFTFWIDFDDAAPRSESNYMKTVDSIISESQKWRRE